MLHTDRCALICDLAEVYHIYDYRSLPASRVATFAVGLRNDSRIKTKMRGDDLKDNDLTDLLLAGISDVLTGFFMGSGKVPSMLGQLMGEPVNISEPAGKQHNGEYMVFSSPEDFEAAWKQTAMEAE